MTDRAAARLAWGVIGFVSLLFAAGAVSYLWEGPSGDPNGVFLSVEMFALLGGRRPRRHAADTRVVVVEETHHQAAHGQPGQLMREAPPGHDGLVAG
jgi:hypothetical protein